MDLTVKHLRTLLARPECADDMPVVIHNAGPDFEERHAEAACIDTYGRFLVSVSGKIATKFEWPIGNRE